MAQIECNSKTYERDVLLSVDNLSDVSPTPSSPYYMLEEMMPNGWEKVRGSGWLSDVYMDKSHVVQFCKMFKM